MWCLILSMDSIVLHIKKSVLQYCLDFGQTILTRMDNVVYWKPKSRLKLHAIWEGWFRNFFDAWVEGYRRIYSQAKTKIYLRFIYKVGFLSEAYFTELQTATESTQLLKGCYPQLVLNPPCFKMGITKRCTHLHSPPTTSSHPTPSTLTQLIPTSTQLHPSLPTSFQSPPSTLQRPQQYLNQNIGRNWAISPNLGWKIKSCSF